MARKSREANLAYGRAYREAHRLELRVKGKEYRARNLEKERARGRLKSKNTSPDKRKIIRNRYAKTHRAALNAYEMKRYAEKLNRTPKWLRKQDFLEIKKFYMLATSRTNETGVKHEVDHIIPLRGKYISGLHVPSNLQVLTKSENCRKNNKVP